MAYQARKPAPPHRTISRSVGAALIACPKPATPRRISVASETAQKSASGKTCRFSRPCRRMKAFCAPMAMMREPPSRNPATTAVSMEASETSVEALVEIVADGGLQFLSRRSRRSGSRGDDRMLDLDALLGLHLVDGAHRFLGRRHAVVLAVDEEPEDGQVRGRCSRSGSPSPRSRGSPRSRAGASAAACRSRPRRRRRRPSRSWPRAPWPGPSRAPRRRPRARPHHGRTGPGCGRRRGN